MTRLVIEQGPLAPSLVALARSGKPAVAASACVGNQRGKERRGHDLGGIRRLWQPIADQSHRSPLAGMFYSVPATPSLDLALG